MLMICRAHRAVVWVLLDELQGCQDMPNELTSIVSLRPNKYATNFHLFFLYKCWDEPERYDISTLFPECASSEISTVLNRASHLVVIRLLHCSIIGGCFRFLPTKCCSSAYQSEHL